MSLPGFLIWRPARRSDREAISLFVCAEPAKPYKDAATGWKLYHPRMWEFDAQQMIRGLAPKVPTGDSPLHVFVAEDVEGLAGVVSWRQVGGPAEIHLDVIGVAPRHRRQGGVVARAIATAALAEIEAAAIEAGADELYLEGEIWHENDASLQLCGDQKFTLLEDHATGAQTWSLKVPIGGAEVEGGTVEPPEAEESA